jgi:hypothetical protein
VSDPDDVPEGFEFSRSRQLAKAPPPERISPTDEPAATLEEARKPAVAVAAGPAAPSHGRPAGAGNALAFHHWKKTPPKPDAPE